MSVARIIFAITFVLFVGITLIVPSYPPTQLLYEYVGIPQTTLSILGISIATLLNAFINGCFWTIIVITAYGLAQLALVAKAKPLPPMPFPPHLITPQPENPLVDSRGNRIFLAPTIPPTSSFTVKEDPARAMIRTEPAPIMVSKAPNDAGLAIETIKGIGPMRGALFRNSGVDTVSDLLRVGTTARGRKRLAKEVGVTSATVLRWVHQGDLLTVRSIARRYELSESAK
jgi:hypothetical protein